MRYRLLVSSTVIAVLVGLFLGMTAASLFQISLSPLHQLQTTVSQVDRAAPSSRLTESSKNVLRVYGPDVYQTAVAVSQLVYPGPRTDAHPDAQPGVAILVPWPER
ncbi:MAG: hypothetical protein M1343_05935 [Chloroflexi bacterium]|nr:hypothetical protein [Chloroflexota bacterium]